MCIRDRSTTSGVIHDVAADSGGGGHIVLYCIGSKPPPPPQQIRASHDLGLIFQLNGGRALRGTLVAVVSRYPLKAQVGRDELIKGLYLVKGSARPFESLHSY